MWTAEQRQRLALEHVGLHRKEFEQFSVYRDSGTDTYAASGTTSSSSGRHYSLYSPIPHGFPLQRPPVYLVKPFPLLTADGRRVSSVRRIASDAYANAVYVWLGPDLPLARRPLAFCYPPSQGLFKEPSLG